jgi:hypothetical protein
VQNIAEEIAGQYLKLCEGCDFIDYNIQTTEIQGEIDVVGIKGKNKEIFLCEVAAHLETGLQYTKNARPDNVDRFKKKFSKDIEYAMNYFPGYTIRLMLWSPIVKISKDTSKHSQMDDIKQITEFIESKYGIKLDAIINHEYMKRLEMLRHEAAEKSEELKSPVMRYLQIEEKLKKHINKNGRI